MANETIQILVDRVKRGGYRSNQRPPSICRVTNVLRGNSPTSFDPRVVSIGPLHKEDENLKGSEDLKESYVHDLVQHLESTPDKILKECWQKVYASIDQITASYAVIQNFSDEDLANLMVMDGCFILEFFRKILSQEYVNELQKYLISLDLFLLENQIPFFVLQNLFDCTLKKKVSPYSLTKIVHAVLRHYVDPFRTKFQIRDVATDSTPDHLLGCLHKFYQPLDSESPEGIFTKVPSAAELDRAGVSFKAHQDQNYPMAIKFKSSAFTCFHYRWDKPTLLMPVIYIGDETEKILRNFMAYELSFPHVHHYFTSYACAMDTLIDTEEDIGKLIESNIIYSNLGSKQEAADMFNTIGKDIPVPYFYYKKEFKQLNYYYNGIWPKHIARLKRTYFSNPWSAIALIAGIILFTLTVVQTVFTIVAVV